jgi:hypothetical protein
MLLGCRTAVADLPGNEYLSPAVAGGDAVLVPTPAALADALATLPLAGNPEIYYAPPRLPHL